MALGFLMVYLQVWVVDIVERDSHDIPRGFPCLIDRVYTTARVVVEAD